MSLQEEIKKIQDALGISVEDTIKYFGKSLTANDTLKFINENNPLANISPYPKYSLEKTSKSYIYRFDVPDVKKSELQVLEKDNMLIVRGNRNLKNSEDGSAYLHSEIKTGPFERKVNLEFDADDNFSAKLESGLLVVTVPIYVTESDEENGESEIPIE